MAVGVLLVGMIQAVVAFGVFRNLNLPRIGKELLLVSFWFLPVIFLRDLAGELDSRTSYLYFLHNLAYRPAADSALPLQPFL